MKYPLIHRVSPPSKRSSRRSLTLSLAALLGLTLLPAIAVAETIVIPVGQQAMGKSVSTPITGMSMTTVENQFGAPAQRFPAQGQPPITRWEYEHFVVYFEDDKVIHSVVRFKPGSAST